MDKKHIKLGTRVTLHGESALIVAVDKEFREEMGVLIMFDEDSNKPFFAHSGLNIPGVNSEKYDYIKFDQMNNNCQWVDPLNPAVKFKGTLDIEDD